MRRNKDIKQELPDSDSEDQLNNLKASPSSLHSQNGSSEEDMSLAERVKRRRRAQQQTFSTVKSSSPKKSRRRFSEQEREKAEVERNGLKVVKTEPVEVEENNDNHFNDFVPSWELTATVEIKVKELDSKEGLNLLNDPKAAAAFSVEDGLLPESSNDFNEEEETGEIKAIPVKFVLADVKASTSSSISPTQVDVKPQMPKVTRVYYSLSDNRNGSSFRPKYTCSNCGNQFEMFQAINHVLLHLKMNDDILCFSCPVPECVFRSYIRNGIAYHIRKMHPGHDPNHILLLDEDAIQRTRKLLIEKVAECFPVFEPTLSDAFWKSKFDIHFYGFAQYDASLLSVKRKTKRTWPRKKGESKILEERIKRISNEI